MSKEKNLRRMNRLKKSFGSCDVQFPLKVNEENYFVLGDNREDSVDSRNEALGLVKGEDVLGKVFLTVWPIGEIKSY